MLEGIRVIDFSFYLPGPYATLRLADMGAEVIKVEPPDGEPARHMGEKKDGTGLVFLANNRNKKSVTLNLKDGDGQEAARKLIKGADVVIESFRPGVTKRLGIDYETVKKDKPDIIYCSISGYGQSGEMSTLGSHDLNYMAVSGALAQMKNDAGEPVHPTNTFADLVGGIGANEAILSALLQRERKGEGCYLDLAIVDVMTLLMTNHLAYLDGAGEENGVPLLGGSVVSYQIYQTKDNRYMALAALEKKFWENFCKGIGREDLLRGQYAAAKDGDSVYEEMKALFRSRSMEEWTDFGLKTDCCLTPVLETSELSKSPVTGSRQVISDPGWGIRQVHSGNVEVSSLTPPPETGEHTEEAIQKDKNRTQEAQK